MQVKELIESASKNKAFFDFVKGVLDELKA